MLRTVVLALAASMVLHSQAPSVTRTSSFLNTERRTLRDKASNIEYLIDVALPRDYREGEKRYPVFYTLDGNEFFSLISESARLLRINPPLLRQDLIIVGIGYPEIAPWSDEYGNAREHDYTTKPAKPINALGRPMPAKEVALTGGAASFLDFIQKQLIPFIDSSYRTIPGDRAIAGHSLGGLFAVYVLTHAPETFQRYTIGSPSLWWDDKIALRWEADYAATHRNLRARVYMYLAEYDGDVMTVPGRQFWDALQARHYSGVDLAGFVVVPGETHGSVSIGSIERALRLLYAPQSIPLSAAALKRFAGTWRSDEENATWTIRFDDGHLFINIRRLLPDYPLFAESENVLASNLDEVRIVFQPNGASNKPTEMTLTSTLGTFHATRVDSAQ